MMRMRNSVIGVMGLRQEVERVGMCCVEDIRDSMKTVNYSVDKQVSNSEKRF